MQPLHCEKRGDQHLVFGWANVAVTADGQSVEDLQGDVIDPADLETAAYEFVLHYREADEMHDGPVVGQLVEMLAVTPEKLQAMGFAEDVAKAMPQGMWLGFKVSPDTFEKVKRGELSMFSIEGTAVTEPV